MQNAVLVTASSQLPSTQGNPCAKVACFGVAYSVILQFQLLIIGMELITVLIIVKLKVPGMNVEISNGNSCFK